MAYLQSIKTSLIEQHPQTKESSLDLYITQVQNILKFISGKDLTSDKDLLLIIKNLPLLEGYFDDNKRSDTTRANYYSSLLEVLKAVDSPAKGIKSGINKAKMYRDKYRQKYEKIEDGLKSKKQDESFISAKTINDKIDEYEKQIKEGSEDKDLLQIWIILKILREFRFRNEIASLEFVDKKTYDEELEKDEKERKRNLIVMSPEGWFISKNQYKTDKKYGEVIIPLEGSILNDIQFYHKQVGDGMLFKSSFQKGKRSKIMTSNSLTKYMIKWSNKELPPIILEDGSKKPRNLSTTMIVKVYESFEHGASKKKLLKDSKNRGNKPATMSKVYVSTKDV